MLTPIFNKFVAIVSNEVVRPWHTKSLATTFKNSKDENEYIDQLTGYGFSKDEATSAWEIKSNGGSNLLLNLQQADTLVEIDQKDDGHGSSDANE